jgi:hypothetical protein
VSVVATVKSATVAAAAAKRASGRSAASTIGIISPYCGL